MTTNTTHTTTQSCSLNEHTPNSHPAIATSDIQAPELALEAIPQRMEAAPEKDKSPTQDQLDIGKNLCDFWSHSKRSRGSYFIENIESILKNKNN